MTYLSATDDIVLRRQQNYTLSRRYTVYLRVRALQAPYETRLFLHEGNDFTAAISRATRTVLRSSSMKLKRLETLEATLLVG
jgi:hypothetical protein